MTAVLIVAAIILTLCEKTTGNVCLTVLVDGSAAEYAAELDAREKLYLDPTIKDLALEPLSVTPFPLYFSDLTTGMDDWSNQALCLFYDKNTVVVKSVV